MIRFYGIWQLVKVIKEDKTKKGDTFVQFVAATQRGDETDFKLFDVFGHNADYMLRNLTKDNDGKYLSRKMFIEGYVKTYNDTQDIKCTADINKNMIPLEIGMLKQDITVNATTQIKIPKDIYIVSTFDFVDKPRDNGVSILVNNEIVTTNDNSENKTLCTTTNNTINNSSAISQIRKIEEEFITPSDEVFNLTDETC